MKIFKILTLSIVLFSSLLQGQKLEDVSLQLQWKHAFQFAGYYIAKEKGFYKDKNLNVEIKEFQYGLDITSDVESGISTYGIGRPSVIIEKENGKDIVLLSAIYQSSPLIVLTTEKSNIKSISDFRNKNIMTVNDSSNDAAINAMMRSYKISLKDMNKKSHTFKVEDLINGNTDLLTAYIADQPFKLKELGYRPVIFHPKDYGFDFYSDILFTGISEQSNNPRRVDDFNKASLKGWEYAFDNIEETVELILKKYNTQNMSKKALLYEAKELKKLAYYNTKQIGTIDEDNINKIIGIYKLTGLIKEDIFDDYLLLEFIAGFILIFFIVIYFLIKQKNLNKKIEKRVLEEIDKNREKDQKLLQQTKLAQMGEMLNMIAHQWRQPLGAIGATTQNIEFKIEMGVQCDKKFLLSEMKLITEYTNHLSQTIEDFRGFFKEDKSKEVVVLEDVVTNTLSIVNKSLEHNNIEIVENFATNTRVEVFVNELKQVILNLIKNAEDILVDSKIKNPKITIETKVLDNSQILTVKDNAGGIPDDIMDKIFQPYFSTKKEKNGTGLGLYMSKTIIEEHCGGKLEVCNDKDGAVFSIILEKEKGI